MARLFGVLFLPLFLAYLSEGAPVKDNDFALKFLMKYKYLPRGRATGADVSEGITRFQRFFRLPVSGVLDKATKDLMKKPRCGNGDLVQVSMNSQGKRYVTAQPWSKTHLTYRFINHGQDLYWMKVEEIVAEAFAFWSRVSGLTFSKSTANSADINILFGRYNHGDYYPFDGPGGTLAHAFFPSDGRVHFDEDETYTHETSSGTNLLWVAVHELGHALGLHHTNIYGAVMYPFYQGYKPDMQLHGDDIQGIQSLYPPTGPATDPPATNPPATDPPATNPPATDPPATNPPATNPPETNPPATNPPATNPPATNPPVQTSTQKPTTPVRPQTTQKDCKDKISYCDDLYDADYCRIYPDNMAYWCKKTCGKCETHTHSTSFTAPVQTSTQKPTTPVRPQTTQKDCKDKISYCDDLYDADYCRIYPDNMAYWCKKTCGKC